MANSKHVVYTSDGPYMEGAVKVSGRKGPAATRSGRFATPAGGSLTSSTTGPGSNMTGQSQLGSAVQGSMPVVNKINITKNPDGTIGTNVEVADSTPVTGPGVSRRSAAPNGSASAVGVQTGWVHLGNGYKYYDETIGRYITGWHSSDNADGTKTWYYLDEDSLNKEWMVTGWKKITGKRGTYWYYFRPDGKMSIYWEVLNGMWYYLEPQDDGGNMVMGWKEINGSWYYFIPEKDAGYMMIDWLEINGKWYYFYNSDDKRGIMAADHMVNHTDGKQYYLGSDGAMVTSITFKSAEDGKTYSADENGVCSRVNNVTSNIDQIIQNIMDDRTLKLTDTKKITIAEICRVMLDDEYEVAFVAGMLANIIHEGTAGYFESSNYKTNPKDEPDYLVYMDRLYDYRSKYSGTYITDHSLSEVYNLLKTLESHNWKQGKFGLGSVQWTGGRTKTLVDKYKDVAGNNDRITPEQVLEAEGLMISFELKYDNDYNNIYPSWKNVHAGNLESAAAAYSAGYDLCIEYESAQEEVKKAPIRAGIAKDLYGIMIKSL